jgi:hypothetical protein
MKTTSFRTDVLAKNKLSLRYLKALVYKQNEGSQLANNPGGDPAGQFGGVVFFLFFVKSKMNSYVVIGYV